MGKSQIIHLKMKNQLLNEIKILEIVEHPAIIKMFTYFEDASNIYLVLELGGKHLYEVLKKKGKFPEAEAAKVRKKN